MAVIYFNGNILTMDDACKKVQALLVDGGKIAKRGTNQEVLACKRADTSCIDLQGKTMMPGFIDGHGHFGGLANALSQCQLSGAENFQQIVSMMQEYIRTNKIPAGEWVVGTNYDHNFLAEKRHPDKTVLDQISTEHPIVIIHASSHMGVANSLALEKQKIGAGTLDPEGGRYGRTPSGECNGYMEEKAFVHFRNGMPMLSAQRLMELYRKAQEIYASYGITTVQEGMVAGPLFQILQYAQRQNVFYLDLVAYIDLENSAQLLTSHPQYLKQYQDHLKIGGYKIFLDGSPQGRTAWMKAPYEGGEDGYCGYPLKKNQQVHDLIVAALESHQQLLAHCNGDAAAEQYLTQFEKVVDEHPGHDTNRPVMIHAQLVQKEQLERMDRLSMMPSFFIAHTYYWGDIHIQNFGMARAANISPAGSALALGLPFTFHQDSPVLMPDVFRTIWCAVRRVTKGGTELAKSERIGVYDALKAMTVHSAYQYFEEDQKGAIREGMLADLIILERDPLTAPVDEIKEIRVLETIKEGRTVYKRNS